MNVNLLILAGCIFFTLCVFGIRALYVNHKVGAAKEKVAEMIGSYSSTLGQTKNSVKNAEPISVRSEIVSNNETLKATEEKGHALINEITELLQNSSTDIREVFEAGYSKDPNYVTPQVRLSAIECELTRLNILCNFRIKSRADLVLNEFSLRCRLKHPIDLDVELPDELARVAAIHPELIKLIPSKKSRLVLESLGSPTLMNSMGMTLIDMQPVLNHILKMARDPMVISRANGLYASAKTSYANVEFLNDLNNWYEPSRDDGKFNGSAYTKALNEQSAAINAMKTGDMLVAQLNGYRNEVCSQSVSWVSDNYSRSTSFRHSKTKYYTDPDGDEHSKTVWFSTDGMYFYVQITTDNGQGSRTTTEQKVGEKDSHDYVGGSWGSSWRTWDYKTEQTQGYLIQYKPFGKDNSSIERGGQYDPARHQLFNMNAVPSDAVNH